MIQSYRDLTVWQRSMDLTCSVYAACAKLPNDERYALSAQMRKAAVSIPANIAEGHGRETTGAFVQFLRVAQGSLKELETHVELARRLKLWPEETTPPLAKEADEIGRMLRALIRSLESSQA
jgi:four helix bundle protein